MRFGGCSAWLMVEVALVEVIVFTTMPSGVPLWSSTTNDTMKGPLRQQKVEIKGKGEGMTRRTKEKGSMHLMV